MGNKIKKSDLLDMFKEANKPLEDKIKDIESRQTKLVGDSNIEDVEEKPTKKSELKFTAKRPDPAGKVADDEFSFVRFCQAVKKGNWEGADYERWAIDETERKSLAWASGSSGGYLVGAEFLPEEFIEHYKSVSICRQAGCRVLPCTGAPINIPKATAGVTVYWPGQNASITASDITPAQLQLTPKICAARSQVSMTLFKVSQGSVENIIRNDMASELGLAIDNEIMEGPGTTNRCTGMANTSSINTVSAGYAAITIAKLRDMEYEMQVDNVKFKKPAYLMHPRTWHNICEIVKGSTARDFVLHVDRQPGEAVPKNLFGYPVYLSTQISITNTTTESSTCANVFLADMDDVILAEWGGIELDATTIGGNAWSQYAMEIRAVAQLDVGVRNPNSVCLINDTTS